MMTEQKQNRNFLKKLFSNKDKKKKEKEQDADKDKDKEQTILDISSILKEAGGKVLIDGNEFYVTSFGKRKHSEANGSNLTPSIQITIELTNIEPRGSYVLYNKDYPRIKIGELSGSSSLSLSKLGGGTDSEVQPEYVTVKVKAKAQAVLTTKSRQSRMNNFERKNYSDFYKDRRKWLYEEGGNRTKEEIEEYEKMLRFYYQTMAEPSFVDLFERWESILRLFNYIPGTMVNLNIPFPDLEIEDNQTQNKRTQTYCGKGCKIHHNG